MGYLSCCCEWSDISRAQLMKTEHLVNYDYQHGGVWAFVLAESGDEIRRQYPELEVVDSKPQWMTPEVEDRIRTTLTIDIDDANHPFFAALVKQRSEPRSG